MGGQEKLIFFSLLHSFYCKCPQHICFYVLPFFSHPNTPPSTSFCSLTDGLFPPAVLWRGDPSGRGTADAESRPLSPFPAWANASPQTGSAGLPDSAPQIFLLSLPQGDTGCSGDHWSRCCCMAPSATRTCKPAQLLPPSISQPAAAADKFKPASSPAPSPWAAQKRLLTDALQKASLAEERKAKPGARRQGQ